MKTFSSNSSTSLRFLAILLLLGISTGAVLSGCRPPEETTTNSDENSSTDSTDELSSEELQCENWIQSIVTMSHPEQLTIKVENDVVLGLLNDWASNCGSSGASNLDTEQLKQWLTEEQIQNLTSDRFSEGDAAHIRDSILRYLIWESVATDQETDLQRVLQAFNFVIYNMALVPEVSQFHLSRHELLLWGLGTAEDRALLFADILRQNRIDCCILTPDKSTPEKPIWFVGVLLRDGIYLFNTQLGMPIPGPENDDASFEITEVATLEQIINDESLLKKLDIDEEHPFPLTSEEMKTVKVEMIGYPELWMPRFSRFQAQLPLDQKFLLHDGLIDSKSGQGLPSRLVTQSKGQWKLEDLKIWSYPLDRAQNKVELTSQQKQIKELFEGSLRAYFEGARELNGEEVIVKVTPSNAVWQTRLAYLSGKHDQAIKQFVGIQVVINGKTDDSILSAVKLERELERPEEAAQTRWAMDNLVYWLANAQQTVGRSEQAAGLFSDYIREHKGVGFWSKAAVSNVIPAYARSGKYALAIQLLQQVIEQQPEGTLERHAVELQLKQIRYAQQQERLKEAN
ncbi:MAG: hypothetical protein KDA65_05120 [Planctomycetaceae bacterium]|nr:hypothetical protein [Planctomycetaceae bacterium]